MNRLSLLMVCSAVALPAGCDRHHGRSAPPSAASLVAATNSYLEAAAAEILQPGASVFRLAEPGTCPGHFDIRPSQIEALRRCRVLLRFEFQASIDQRLGKLRDEGLHTAVIRVPGGLCEPDSYLAACRQVADALVSAGLVERTVAEDRLRTAESRVHALAARCREHIAARGWHGRPVICSLHQEAFCRWLGLEVAGTYSGADTASIGQVEQAIQAGERLAAAAVIANRPEGRKVADALGRRLNAPVVVFGNFPDFKDGDEPPFDALLVANVEALLAADAEPTTRGSLATETGPS